ncbi:MAG: cyclic nucleotide-binding domain-containing protein [Burkholderiaceae bacterium]|nr:cyclic nucleotide-binding domain-containing protein [Burkholderiaceae bacterium]
MQRRFVCPRAQVPANGMIECEAEGGLALLVVNSGDDYFAYQALCPHQDAPLCEGLYDGTVLTCHQHLWQWDIRTGAPMGLAEEALESFPVQVEGDSIYVVAQSALNAAELLIGISEPTLAAITALAQKEDRDAGSICYDFGAPADDFYILESGRVEFVIGRDGRLSPAGFMLRKGEVFGWAALLDSQPQRIARATCLEPSRLLRINGKQTLELLEKDSVSGYLVMRRLSSLIARYLAASGSK